MTTLAQQWLEQGRQEGLQKGIQQGMQQGIQQNILKFLDARLQIPAQRFRGRIEAIHDLETLRLLVRRAATVDSADSLSQAFCSAVGL
jgi:flagellar biosynthesis/type III secretory pathway protein FliH